jgi:hypothetical protein
VGLSRCGLACEKNRNINTEDDVIALLRCIGLSKGPVKPVPLEKGKELFEIASMNKIGLFFLESLASLYEMGWFQPKLKELRRKCQNTKNLIVYVASLLNSRADYFLFKTLKPFPYTPSDIDILLRSKADFYEAYYSLRRNGLILLERNAYGATMYSREHDLNVDLHLFLTVSDIPYLDPETLFRYMKTVEFKSLEVQILEPPAEFLTVAAHSFYKEHMFNLSDFYTILSLAQQARSSDIYLLAGVEKVSDAVYFTVKICKQIMKRAFNSVDPALLRLEKYFDESNMICPVFEQEELNFFPYKYSKMLVMYSLFRKIMVDPLTRSFLLPALARNVRKSRLVMLKTHFSRKSY